ncbi:hypothetical protein [Caloranaerobacter sp. DY30410]|uniref:hypothetical protein n=1 Tax=Caloranaerobacter sp. DY30410 TaxID=3238305 RepID=UPI003CFE6C23
MKIKVKRIKGYNCPNKLLLLINNEPVAFANGMASISKMIQYAEGYDVDIKDGKIKRILSEYRGIEHDETTEKTVSKEN